jgi:hypothetical protein
MLIAYFACFLSGWYYLLCGGPAWEIPLLAIAWGILDMSYKLNRPRDELDSRR